MAETNRQQLYAMVYETVCEIPAGKVATYGQIAQLMGLPRHARHVGFALSHLTADSNVPWHRVINAKGQLHPRPHRTGVSQRQLLQDEGIVFDQRGGVSLKRYQWRPALNEHDIIN